MRAIVLSFFAENKALVAQGTESLGVGQFCWSEQ